ncbi:MAG TPA: hypothetical protein PK299_09980 [Anaerolineales bacterium]|nr:hypothetical protein [Anaerolineales bacterium]
MTDFLTDFSAFERDVHKLQGLVQLQTVLDNLEDVQTNVQKLSTRLKQIREQGYVFHRSLESEAQALQRQWSGLQGNLRTQVQQQTQQLQPSMRVLESRLAQIAVQKNSEKPPQTLLASSKALADTLEKKAEAAEKTISGMYDQLNQQIQSLMYRLGQVEWMQTQLSEASFPLMEGECGIAAVKAVWCADTKEQPDDPEGVLYLTDQRIIFEQKEEVATRKVLFITTAKKKVQEIEWALPLQTLESVQTRKLGMLKNEDYLDLRFVPPAERASICLHIWQPAEQWQALLNQAKAGELDSTRTQPAPTPPARQLPSECPRCGASLPQTVMRGQQSLKCDYCGNEVRIG